MFDEQCLKPASTNLASLIGNLRTVNNVSFFQIDDMCLEKRAFYRVVSGLHSSISIHLCANYPIKQKQPGFCSAPGEEKWGPNLGEFTKRFDGKSECQQQQLL